MEQAAQLKPEYLAWYGSIAYSEFLLVEQILGINAYVRNSRGETFTIPLEYLSIVDVPQGWTQNYWNL